jgi:hypothetical protein
MKLHNENLHNLYFSSNVIRVAIRRTEVVEHVARVVEMKIAHET